MAKKIHISVLYNEPVTIDRTSRQYVSENGQLKEAAQRIAAQGAHRTRTRQRKEQPWLDLSEVGVMEEMEDIKTALSALGYKPNVFNVDGDLNRLIEYLRSEKPDLVFNLVECVENESLQEMNVAGMYELMKIPYTGADPLGLGISLNKPRVKEILAYYDILTPRFQVFQPSTKIVVDERLRFPLIVKPSREDASVGIDDKSVVYTLSDLKSRVRYILEEFDQPALVEEYIDGRELNVAILGNKPPAVLPISEIDFSGLEENMHKIVSYAAKWISGSVAYDGTQGVCPAPLTPEQEVAIKDIALRCYRIIGCRDYARVDLRLAKDGTPYVLEVNPNPDISDEAGFARSARAYGLSFPEVIGRIVEVALERYA